MRSITFINVTWPKVVAGFLLLGIGRPIGADIAEEIFGEEPECVIQPSPDNKGSWIIECASDR